MLTQIQRYRSIRRQQPALPALSAWRHAGHQLEVDHWAAHVGMIWNADRRRAG